MSIHKSRLVRACLLIGILATVGCSTTVDQKAVTAIEGSFKVIAEEYLAYVDSDSGLDPDAKARRHKQIEEHKALIGDLKASVDGGK